MGPAGGVRSCVAKYYAAFLDAHQDQTTSGKTISVGNPFKQVVPITTSHAKITVAGFDNQPYCVGWVKGQIPVPLGIISNNSGKLGHNVPEIGKDGASITTLNHAGSMAGAMTGVILFPESKSAVIVLTNTLGLTDSADTVSQLLTEILFDLPGQHDFVHLTQKIVDVELRSLSSVADKLAEDRTPKTTLRVLQDYIGLEEETFAMQHYEHDTFTWWCTRNECARRGRFTNYESEYFKINFIEEAGVINRLTWRTVSQLPDPEMFCKDLGLKSKSSPELLK